MKTMTVVNGAAMAAGFVPRPVAPALDLIQGSGVSAYLGIRPRLRGEGLTSATEPDSVTGALTV